MALLSNAGEEDRPEHLPAIAFEIEIVNLS